MCQRWCPELCLKFLDWFSNSRPSLHVWWWRWVEVRAWTWKSIQQKEDYTRTPTILGTPKSAQILVPLATKFASLSTLSSSRARHRALFCVWNSFVSVSAHGSRDPISSNNLETKKLYIAFWNVVVGVFFIDKHLGECTFSEILLARSLSWIFGRWEKALPEDR